MNVIVCSKDKGCVKSKMETVDDSKKDSDMIIGFNKSARHVTLRRKIFCFCNENSPNDCCQTNFLQFGHPVC